MRKGFLILYSTWGNAQIFPHIWGGHLSYMTFQLLCYEFPYIWGKFDCLCYQCWLNLPTWWNVRQKVVISSLHYLYSLVCGCQKCIEKALLHSLSAISFLGFYSLKPGELAVKYKEKPLFETILVNLEVSRTASDIYLKNRIFLLRSNYRLNSIDFL